MPCAGLDVGTRDEAGNIYFSTWSGGVYEPLLLGAQASCVAKIAAGSNEVVRDFAFQELTGGLEGGAVRHFRDGKLLMSIFDHEKAGLLTAEDPWKVIGEPNWRTWLYDPATRTAAPVESIDWNSGATFVFQIGGRTSVPTRAWA